MPSEQDFISRWFNGAHLHVSTSYRTPRGFSPSSKVINTSSVYEYYVIKSGYDEDRLTKQNHSTAFLNTDRKGKLVTGVGPPFACNTACILLGIDSCKFWIVSSEILYHSSSSCLIDDGGKLRLLTLLSKTHHSGSIIFKAGDCARQRRCWSASSCSSHQD
jgi:hypothetical protein